MYIIGHYTRGGEFVADHAERDLAAAKGWANGQIRSGFTLTYNSEAKMHHWKAWAQSDLVIIEVPA